MNILIILVGFFAGIVSGMGIGGGALLIPALHIFAQVEHKTAQSINLFYFIPTAVAAVMVHIKKKNIEFKPLIPILISGAVGAAIGGMTAMRMQSDILRKMFGAFLLILAVKEVYSAKKSRKLNKNEK